MNFKTLRPSTVLAAMVEGLKESKSDPHFFPYMSLNEYVEGCICYGSPQSVALAKMFGAGKSASELMLSHAETGNHRFIRMSAILSTDDFSYDHLSTLEHTIDFARRGEVSCLISSLSYLKDKKPNELGFFDAKWDFMSDKWKVDDLNYSFDTRWYLKEDNWEKQLPIVQETSVEMIAAGL
jgi:hypothetical protein